jgi:hypothetical protein
MGRNQVDRGIWHIWMDDGRCTRVNLIAYSSRSDDDDQSIE